MIVNINKLIIMKTVKTIFKKITTSIAALGLFLFINHSASAQQSIKEKHDSTKVEAERKNLGKDRKQVLKDVGDGNGKQAKADYKEMRVNEKNTKADKKQWKADRKRRKANEQKSSN